MSRQHNVITLAKSYYYSEITQAVVHDGLSGYFFCSWSLPLIFKQMLLTILYFITTEFWSLGKSFCKRCIRVLEQTDYTLKNIGLWLKYKQNNDKLLKLGVSALFMQYSLQQEKESMKFRVF